MKREVTSWFCVVVLLVCATAVDASAFAVGDTVKVVANTNVRTGPGTNYVEIKDPDYPGTARAGTVGKITAGPQNVNGYAWWRVDFGPGLYSGWAVQDGLQVTTPARPTSCAKSSELHGSQVNFAQWGWTNPLPSENMYVSSYGGFMDSLYPKTAGIHLGVDLLGPSNGPVAVGTPVLAVCSGTVIDKMATTSYRNVYNSAILVVDASSRAVFVYGHVRDPQRGPLVKIGDRVAAGQQIAEIGPITEPNAWHVAHLHLGVNTQGRGYFYHPQRKGWGIAPTDATDGIILEKGWVDPVVYLCEHLTKTMSGVSDPSQQAPDEPKATGLQPVAESKSQQQPQSVLKPEQEKLLYSLLQKLRDEDPSVRQVTARELGEIHDPRVVQPLIDLMKGKVPYSGPLKNVGEIYYVREEAAEALGKIGDPRAVEPLVTVLKDSNRKLRQQAANALARLQDPRAVEPLTSVVKNDEDRYVREAAIRALGDIGDPRPVDLLISALKGEITAPSAQFDKLDDVAAGALSQIGAPAVGPLIGVLEIAYRENNSDLRIPAERALGHIQDQRAVEPLIAALKNAQWQVREVAVTVLGGLKSNRAVEPLIAALTDNHPNVRVSVEKALRSLTGQDLGYDQLKWKQWWERRAEETPQTTSSNGSGATLVISPRSESSPAQDSTTLSQKLDRLLRVFADPASFPAPLLAATLRLSAPALVEKVESLYFAALDYQFLSVRSLRIAKQYVGIGDSPSAEKCIENAQRYYQIAIALHRDSQAMLDGTYSATQTATEGVKTACQTASSLGLGIMNPVLGEAVDYLYVAADYAVDWVVIGQDEAQKQALIRLLVRTLFDEIKFPQLDNRTISDYMSNRVGKGLFPIIDDLLRSEEAKFAVSRLVKEVAVTASEEVILFQMLNSTAFDQPAEAGLRMGAQSGPQGLPRSVQQPSQDTLLYSAVKKLRDEDPNLRREATISLEVIKDPRAVEPLMRAVMNDESSVVRLAAIGALGDLGDPRPVALLISVLRGEIKAPSASKESLGEAAASALPRLGEPAVGPLIRAFEIALRKKDESTQRLVERALENMKDQRALAPLLAALKHEDWKVRYLAAKALKGLNDHRAIEALIDALPDKRILVRSSVEEALRSLTGQDFGSDQLRWKQWWERRAEQTPKTKNSELPAWVYEPLTHKNTNYSPRYPRRLRATASEISTASERLVYSIAGHKDDMQIRNRIDQLTFLRTLVITEMQAGLKGELESLRPDDAEDLKNNLVRIVEQTGEIISLAAAPAYQNNLDKIKSSQSQIAETAKKIWQMLQ